TNTAVVDTGNNLVGHLRMDFFFFQAEDGIRDKLVTGVQTCALPISDVRLPASSSRYGVEERGGVEPGSESQAARGGRQARLTGRSEERRVGKECRGGWWA